MSVIYNSFRRDILNGIKLDTDPIRVILVDASYVPNIDTDTTYGSVTSAEVPGVAGYATSGMLLTNSTLSADNIGDKGVWNADPVVWSPVTVTAGGAILYKETGSSATSPLITYIGFNAPKTANNGSFTVQWNAQGIINLF